MSQVCDKLSALIQNCDFGTRKNYFNKYFAQAKPRFCVSAPVFAKTFAFAGKVNAARVVRCALKGRDAEENSDCAEQCEDNGVFLKSRKFVLSAQNKF